MKFRYGRNVLITGGSSGIGRCIAELYAQHGYRIFAASRSGSGAIQRFAGEGVIYPVSMDVCSEATVSDAVSEIIDQWGSIDILIHCAGFGIAGAAADVTNSQAHRQMETNYFGVLNVNRCVLPQMCRRNSGLVIIVGSVAGIIPIPYQAHYASSKFALEAYAAVLRMELHKVNVRVALVEPGDTKTGFTTARDFEIDEASVFYEECIRAVGKMEQDENSGDPPMKVAKRVLKLAQKNNPPLRNVIGFGYKLSVFAVWLLPDRIALWILRRRYGLS